MVAAVQKCVRPHMDRHLMNTLTLPKSRLSGCPSSFCSFYHPFSHPHHHADGFLSEGSFSNAGQPLLLLVMDIRISGGSLHSDLLYIGKVVVPIIMIGGDRLQDRRRHRHHHHQHHRHRHRHRHPCHHDF